MKTIIIALSVVALVGCDKGSSSNNNNSTNYLSVNTINAEKLALTTSTSFQALSTGSSNEANDRLVKIDAQGIASAVFNQEVSVNAVDAGKQVDDFIIIAGDFKNKLQPVEETTARLRTFSTSSGVSDNANIDVNECTAIAVPKNSNTDTPVCLANGAAVTALATYEDAGLTYYAFFEMDNDGTFFQMDNNGNSSLKVWDGVDEIINVYTMQKTYHGYNNGNTSIINFTQLIVANNNIALQFTDGCCDKKVVVGNKNDGFNVLDAIQGALFASTKAIIFNGYNNDKFYDATTNTLSSITSDSGCNSFDTFYQRNFYLSDIAVSTDGAIYYLASQANNDALCKFSDNAITKVTDYTYNKLLVVSNIAYVLGKDADNINFLHKIDLIADTYIDNNLLQDLSFASINSMSLTGDNLISISGTNTSGQLQTTYFDPETLQTSTSLSNVAITRPVQIQ
tara:strand:- start:4710 stop:6068 length:1359 start_codon:yes stop_codon:yes gene_type:complete